MKRWMRWLMMAALTAGAAWPSYLHGLFIARQVGYSGNVAFDVPLLPDGLIGVATVALIEASQRKVTRPWSATIGLGTGIVLTTAQNIAAGYPHPGTMVVNAFVPLLLLIALEILVWSSRLARTGTTLTPVAADALAAAAEAYAQTVLAGNPLSQNQLQERFKLTRAEARQVAEVKAALNGHGDA